MADVARESLFDKALNGVEEMSLENCLGYQVIPKECLSCLWLVTSLCQGLSWAVMRLRSNEAPGFFGYRVAEGCDS